ncbi:response regulator transcription factor [Mycolicibacterium tusciae]|uniref:response regulator transcription factor n=1 Tax=Mycolicibacterium tusciae TaxID=75922 RepID=UPI0011E4F223|nr:response regulator transcription factor [Mycolicibacterium tusciae]
MATNVSYRWSAAARLEATNPTGGALHRLAGVVAAVFSVDPARHRLTRGEVEVELTSHEYGGS